MISTSLSREFFLRLCWDAVQNWAIIGSSGNELRIPQHMVAAAAAERIGPGGKKKNLGLSYFWHGQWAAAAAAAARQGYFSSGSDLESYSPICRLPPNSNFMPSAICCSQYNKGALMTTNQRCQEIWEALMMQADSVKILGNNFWFDATARTKTWLLVWRSWLAENEIHEQLQFFVPCTICAFLGAINRCSQL